MNRTVNVIRMQLINRQTFIWLPLIILGASFLMSLAIYAMIPVDGPKYGGGAQAPLWYFLAVGVQAMTLSFPFSQALSITRREFYLGTLLTAVLTSVILAAVFVVGGFLEQATNGWGLNGWFFRLPWVWEQGPAAAAVVYFGVAMLLFVVGFGCALLYKRFGALGLTLTLVGIGVLLVAAMYLVGRANAWAALFEWIMTQGALGLSLWGLLLAAVIAVASFFTLRRATP
ncbi:hypothetical protein IF188_05655 [Microbacterium sp. NEAU-LLC]|uniref:ABC transporter permease n=1 Tax=Microbacterium helvum TaxID=2773713 RepID=A0ABR8NLA3_9MICO|nr:hypothetical protein [Microbacterium helvum]MBD3941183.1 hypothetical protein [Microbacterium helvum]